MNTIHPSLAEYVPSPGDPFDAVKAAHLLNRAGFGGTREEVERVRAMGPSAAVDWLMDFPDAPAEERSQDDVPNLASIDGFPKSFREIAKLYVGKTEEEKKEIRQKIQMANREALVATSAWWLKRMTYGPSPLQEKLTLFWHGHFTSSAKDERAAVLIWNQNELLRRYAAGNFADFVRAVSRDPAMLDYLNNSQNRKGHPNENYARELMELFTLGIGNYTEQDIKEAARAFTGWAHDGEDYVFRPRDHDAGDKTFFGRAGNFNGDDVISMILQRPTCAQYIGTKLYKYFVSEQIEQPVTQSLGQALLENRYELRPLIRTLLTSRAFYSPAAVGGQIKSPVQLVVGTVRLLGLDLPPQGAVMSVLNQMGQVPFMPPNVKGWPGGRNWINTSTLFVRYNTGVWLAGGEVPALYRVGRKAGGKQAPNGVANRAHTAFEPSAAQASPEAVVDTWVAKLIQRPIDPAQRQALIDALGGQAEHREGVRKMIQLIVSMPEYQLC